MVDRTIVEPNEVPYDVDILKSQNNLLIAMAGFIDCIIGSNTSLNAFNAVPDSPASLNVVIEPGQIYQLETFDTTPFGTIPANSSTIMKQGVSLTNTTLATPAPPTAGQSIKYLVQIGFSQTDGDVQTRTFLNAPSQNIATQRQNLALIQIKAGNAAPTGTEVAPSADAGFVGAWIITVANGQTSVTASDIVRDLTAPFILEKLQDKTSGNGAETGDIEFSYRSTTNPKAGWIPLTIDGTIGSASSGATIRANGDTLNLYTMMWDDIPDSLAPVTGGRGGSALADFLANKPLQIPRAAGRALGIAGQGFTLTNRRLGDFWGQESITLSEAQMPPHTHALTNATGVIRAGGPGFAPDSGPQNNQESDITVESSGSGTPIDIMNPITYLNMFIKL